MHERREGRKGREKMVTAQEGIKGIKQEEKGKRENGIYGATGWPRGLVRGEKLRYPAGPSSPATRGNPGTSRFWRCNCYLAGWFLLPRQFFYLP